MSFDSVEALRSAGVLGEGVPQEVVESFRDLSQQETELLISLKGRLSAILPEVVAHSQVWTSPEAASTGMVAEPGCACGLWSGSGSSPAPVAK
ncbi:StsA-related sactipeptide RiPP [Actinospica robiniae]|uniref:StsA-related sactipeptide RiPP n=1 Tax=Actinospica robiniae TaxID=304901 RepID=UPI00040DE59A|nr:StsA-related sactipeptide RiPP [Actinospica robiniae]